MNKKRSNGVVYNTHLSPAFAHHKIIEMSSFVARLVEVAIEEREKFVAESQAECDVLEKELISINE